MAQLNPSEIAAKVAAFVEATGLEVHEEDRDGESYTRISVGKKLGASPQSLLQSVGGFLVLNLPGSTDKALVGAVNLLDGGKSSPPLSN